MTEIKFTYTKDEPAKELVFVPADPKNYTDSIKLLDLYVSAEEILETKSSVSRAILQIYKLYVKELFSETHPELKIDWFHHSVPFKEIVNAQFSAIDEAFTPTTPKE